MIDRFIALVRGGGRYVGNHPQLVLSFALIIIVPVAFVISGQQFLSASRVHQERLEKDRIGMLHDVFISYAEAVSYDPARLQHEIERIRTLNPDLVKFRVVKEIAGEIVVVAAHDPETVGQSVTEPESYLIANTSPQNSMIFPYAERGVRYWQSFRLMESQQFGTHYLFTETSLQYVDALFAKRIMNAYYWLIGLILIVLFFLIRQVRLVDYAYLYQETKKANEMKDLFTNMIAHELRAPLTAIRGYANMIGEQPDVPPTIHEKARRIEDASARLIAIVSDLLDVARIQSGKLSVTKERVKIGPVIESVIAVQAIEAERKHITIVSEGIHTDAMLLADEKRLYQALTNLVSNAIKYTDSGTITLALTDLRTRFEIRVKDTGMGISAENQHKLFSPFFRVESEAVSQITGTGLGMWITKELIELMGGSIGVESIKGVGTHIVIVLPKGV